MINEIWQGDVLELAKKLPDNSIHMICTSPPYWGLRDYGTATWVGGSGKCDHKLPSRQDAQKAVATSTLNGSKDTQGHLQEPSYKTVCGKCGATRIDQQLGLEKTPEEFIEKMVLIFRELRRALRPDGTLWLNLGDSYAGNNSAGDKVFGNPEFNKNRPSRLATKTANKTIPNSLKPKDLCGIPWRVALALQADGWYLRSDIIWSKPNPMPESVTDRPTKAHEYVFLLTKSSRYFYDAEAIREPHTKDWKPENRGNYTNGSTTGYDIKTNTREKFSYAGLTQNENGRNRRTVWEIATQPYPEAHFATYPEALVEPCILAGTSAKGVCSVCGKGWERVVSKEVITNGTGRKHIAGNDKTIGQGWEGIPRATLNTQTLSWQPTCKHNTEPQPAIVLDPFMGSGTTASVAKRLGRSFLGFELNPDYIKLAWKRINAVQPPLIIENDIVVAQYNVVEQLSF